MPSGKPPSSEEKFSDYPHMVKSEVTPNKIIPVVQGYTYGKYLGYLELEFSNSGKLYKAGGNPILLNESIHQDPDILEKVTEMRYAVSNYTTVSIIINSYISDKLGGLPHHLLFPT